MPQTPWRYKANRSKLDGRCHKCTPCRLCLSVVTCMSYLTPCHLTHYPDPVIMLDRPVSLRIGLDGLFPPPFYLAYRYQMTPPCRWPCTCCCTSRYHSFSPLFAPFRFHSIPCDSDWKLNINLDPALPKGRQSFCPLPPLILYAFNPVRWQTTTRANELSSFVVSADPYALSLVSFLTSIGSTLTIIEPFLSHHCSCSGSPYQHVLIRNVASDHTHTLSLLQILEHPLFIELMHGH